MQHEEIFIKARRKALGFSPMDVSYADRRRNLPLLHFHLHFSRKEWMDSSLSPRRGSRHQQEEKSWTHRISSSAITFAIAWTCK